MRSAPAIAFDYRPSRLLIGALISIAALAVLAITASGLSGPLKAGLASIGALTGLQTLRDLLNPPWTRIAYGSAGWRVADRAGGEAAGELARHVRLGPLQVLTLKVQSRAFHFLILPDNLPLDARRRLILITATPASREGAPGRLQ